MPFVWNAETERDMLLIAICSADLHPTAATWETVASTLASTVGEISASAVSQKYHKLKREYNKGQSGTSEPTTPVRAKAKAKATTNGGPKTPSTGGRKRRTKADEDAPNTKRVKKSEVSSETAGDGQDDDGAGEDGEGTINSEAANVKTENTSESD